MADRRMFTKKVTDDDNFQSLSASAQALYLHLSMAADDDGFCNQVAVSMFKAHASVQDLQALLEKRYIYQFENGVIVIKHWRMANALRKDRYTPTAFQEELAQLDLKPNGAYTWLPDGCQTVAECLPQDSTGKDSIKDIKNTPTVYKKDPADEVMELYNEMCPSLPRARALSDARRKHIKKRLVDHNIDEITLAFQKAEASDFCTGRKGGASKWCNLDWMMKSENNLLKILEGNYDNKDTARQKALRDLGSMEITQEQYEDMERRFR